MERQPKAAYIAQSAPAYFLLGVARLREPTIDSLELAFSAPTFTGCNWRVASVKPGACGHVAAGAAVAMAARQNTAWIMVEDGSELDGKQASDGD